MTEQSKQDFLTEIADLKLRLAESEQMLDAIKAGEVDAFALNGNNNSHEIYTLQSGDYAYRLLIENFGEGALNVTQEGLIVYSNTYFTNLIGCDYDEIVGNYFTQFIHTDYFNAYLQLLDNAANGSSKGEIILLHNGKSIPVYISLTSLQPTLDTVGIIITDLTEKKKHDEIVLNYQKELEQKNLELSNTNIELASFSYVASHDLKEPLRKIQMFSRRIQELETFSEKTHDYFNRMILSAERMQNLIHSLLNFSRLNINERVLETCDLNAIVEESKNDLYEIMMEKEAEVEYDNLPAIKGIYLQILQVFNNIIDNAMKYCHADIKPIIKISSKTVTANDVAHLFSSDAREKYYAISISDNGIGFEKEYSKKIFDLFQRLHQKHEYSGTGIGLAIVKKVVANHNGFVEAYSEEGKGATFVIYLPVI